MLKGGEALLSRMSSGLVVHRSGMNSFACLKYFSPVHGILSASATRCSPTQGAGLQNLEGGFRRTARRNILVCNRVVGVETVTPPRDPHAVNVYPPPGGVSLGPLITAGDCILMTSFITASTSGITSRSALRKTPGCEAPKAGAKAWRSWAM